MYEIRTHGSVRGMMLDMIIQHHPTRFHRVAHLRHAVLLSLACLLRQVKVAGISTISKAMEQKLRVHSCDVC